MNFWQRLSRFGIGIVLGIALSLYFLAAAAVVLGFRQPKFEPPSLKGRATRP